MPMCSTLPGIAAVAPTRSSGLTAAEGPRLFFPSFSPTRSFTPIRMRRRTRTPSATLDVQSSNNNIDGSDLRTGDELRSQLDRLQAEADSTRSKANSARMRLIRLSEVAEQLQKQAASKVKAGREDDARELLLQKKKIMLALDKSKNRIEFLDRLFAKLNEAILLKETELIGNVSMHSSISEKDMSSPIRVVPPKIHADKPQECETYESSDDDTGKVQNTEHQRYEASNSVDDADSHVEENINVDTLTTSIDTPMQITSYKDFLEHMDEQLENLQDDLLAFLRLSDFVTEKELWHRNKNIHDLLEFLQDISNLRKRLARIAQTQRGQ